VKLFVKLTLVVVVAAVAAPFFMKGPDGQPLATKEDALSGDTGFARGLVVAVDYAKGAGERVAGIFGAGGGSSGSADVTITEVQKWQDEQGNWHFSNNDIAPKHSETVRIRSDRNIIKTDYTVQLAQQEQEQERKAQARQQNNKTTEPSRISTIEQGMQALQKAGDVQGIMDRRTEQQERLLNSY